MANLIIKSSADNLVLQGSGQSGSDPAITVAAAGTTTFAENATLSGTANNVGTVTAGTFNSTIGSSASLNHDAQKYAWHLGKGTTIDQGNVVVDFDEQIFLGSGLTESGGTINVGANGAGIYLVSYSLSNNSESINDHDIHLRVNGTSIDCTRNYTNFCLTTAGRYTYLDSGTWSGPLRVAASQTIEVYGNGHFYGGDNMGFFCGIRIGAVT